MHRTIFQILVSQLLVVICMPSVLGANENEKNKDKAFSFVLKWAPIIWLDPAEKFFPSSITDYLKEVTPTKINCTKCAVKTSKLPVGSVSSNFFLRTTKFRDDLLMDKSSILYGRNPANQNVTAYAFVKTCDPTYNHFFVTYWFFYPFNEGKKICTMRLGKSKVLPVLKIFKKCLGKTKTYGSHVGDWEHMSLEIKKGIPRAMFLSVHDVGVYYRYDETSGRFLVSHGQARGLSVVTDPPATVQVVDHRPVLFAAKGSHALWGSVGSHKYTRLQLSQLVDLVDYGTAWETWRDLRVFSLQDPAPHWFRYRGRWGNPGSGCLPLSRIGMHDLCLFSDGPRGLSLRQSDFECLVNR